MAMNIKARLKAVVFGAVLSLVLMATGVSGALAGDKDGTLKIAAYNMEWFLDSENVNPNIKDMKGVAPKTAESIEKVAACVRAVDADVLAFEEVENEKVIKQMLGKHLNDMKYKYVAVGQTNSGVGQHVGVMSRKPIVSITSHRFAELALPGHDRKWKFSRDLVKVTIQATPEKTLDVYVVHLKSKRDSGEDKNSNNYRLAEMVMIKKIIGEQLAKDPEAWVVLAGDFNDTPESAPLQTVVGKDEKTGAALLVDPHAGLEGEKRISYLKEPYRSVIDYTLLSPALAKRVVPGKVGLLANEIADKGMLDGSDHSPVFVTLDLGAKSATKTDVKEEKKAEVKKESLEPAGAR
jgi:endonuclease/exonuclease/phosphatase family metal-dependent hydrolase